jgi:hypothetical protein
VLPVAIIDSAGNIPPTGTLKSATAVLPAAIL